MPLYPPPVTVPAAAAQAGQETGTSTTTYVSPGRQQYHPSAAKAWAYVTTSGGTPTLTANYAVSSVGDNGVGDLTFNFSVTFSGTDYVWFAAGDIDTTATNNAQPLPNQRSKATTNVRIQTTTSAGVASDWDITHLVAFGDLA